MLFCIFTQESSPQREKFEFVQILSEPMISFGLCPIISAYLLMFHSNIIKTIVKKKSFF